MARYTHDEAIEILRISQELTELARAIGSLADDPQTTPQEILPALDHPGLVAEQAAIALHRMTQTPWLAPRRPILDRQFWELRLRPEVDRAFRDLGSGSWLDILRRITEQPALADSAEQLLQQVQWLNEELLSLTDRNSSGTSPFLATVLLAVVHAAIDQLNDAETALASRAAKTA